MFTFRCLSSRFSIRSLISSPCRHAIVGAPNPQINNENYQSTINLIKEDLNLIHRDILQISFFFCAWKKKRMASSNDETYESIGLVKPDVNVYVIPPRQSTTRKHRAADWKLDSPNFICRLKIISKGDKCLVRLEDRNTGAHFATCPIENYPSIAVENVEDSTRYFVIRVQNENGQQAFLGIGFNDRSDSFDFNVALQDHFKYIKQNKKIEQEEKVTNNLSSEQQQQSKLDLSFKEGQTIKINLKSSFAGDEPSKKSVKNMNDNFTPGILPPPKSNIPKITPPPPTNSGSNWMQF
ncbi:unnamed protein product [Adineta steineri]|uniref:NECAP PHear domain-containing protein n=1 Tax=Adineta steineri TaxID=433720 RepID=A0A814XC24_9BILA|nr:unnamed protein product [Adineta steineri]